MGAGESSHWSDLSLRVWGEVNPADLFTKHLPSREKVHQLLGLFGCEYREGRAAAAPLLRPHDVDGRQGGHSAIDMDLPTCAVAESDVPHDVTRLPHKHSDNEISKLFPLITAAAAPANVEDWQIEEERLHEYMSYSRQGRQRGSTRRTGRTPLSS